MFMTANLARDRLAARIGLAALLFLAGFLSILGVLFVFVWIGTDHEVGWHNENILQLAPWGVALMGYCFGVARLKPKAIHSARLVATAAAAASLFGLVWKVLPWMRQDNYWIIAFSAPMWIGSALGLRALDLAPAAPPPAKKVAVADADEEGEAGAEPAAKAEKAPDKKAVAKKAVAKKPAAAKAKDGDAGE